MYESHFGLSGPPFQLNPDPQFFFASRGHRHALAYLKFGAHQGEGFIVVSGEIGSGKTTLVRTLLGVLDPTKIVAAQLVSTRLGSTDLLRSIATAFGVRIDGSSKAQLIAGLEAMLTGFAVEGRRALLIIDEAQNLPPDAVEELRMLSNFQLGKHSLLQSFLIGQPELRDLLKSKTMEQLRQRVTASCHLEALDATETHAYIEHRLRRVGWTGLPRIGAKAHEQIHLWTGGIPRRINRLCNRLMLGAFLFESEEISTTLVAKTAKELRAEIGEVGDSGGSGSFSVARDGAVFGSRADAANAALSVPPDAAPVSGRRPRFGSSTGMGALIGVAENRTDFFKLAALAQAFAPRAELPPLVIVHTGTEEALHRGLLADIVLPVRFESLHLGIDGGGYAAVSTRAGLQFGALLDKLAPRAVLSVGTGTVILACTLLAKQRGTTVLRLDAGQRHDGHTPTRALNATLIDRLGDELFTSRIGHVQALCSEGHGADRSHCVGSLASSFLQFAQFEFGDRDVLLADSGVPAAGAERVGAGFGLVTSRLRLDVEADSAPAITLDALAPVLLALAAVLPMVWPVHAAEQAAIRASGHAAAFAAAGVMVVPDRGYLETLGLLHCADFVVGADRGEFDEESIVLGKRALLLGRDAGAAPPTPTEPEPPAAPGPRKTVKALHALLERDPQRPMPLPERWDGRASFRIAERLQHLVGDAAGGAATLVSGTEAAR